MSLARSIGRLTSAMPPQVRARASFLASLRDGGSVDEAQRLHRQGIDVPAIAGLLEVDERSVYRYLRQRMPCPGDRCLTMVRGGGECSFCRGRR